MVTEMKIPVMAKVAASGQVPDNQGWLKSLGSITDMSHHPPQSLACW